MTNTSTTECDATDEANESWCDAARYDNSSYSPGRGLVTRCLWYFVSLLVFESGWVPFYAPKSWLLRLFGARLGRHCCIKPHVRIKYPWRLTAGDYCSIGQEAWIDNLEDVHLGNSVCISQRAYLCTGSHDYRSRTFDLLVRPIQVGDGAWLGACCVVLGGVQIGANAIVAAGSIVTKDVPRAAIVGGNPAKAIGQRLYPVN